MPEHPILILKHLYDLQKLTQRANKPRLAPLAFSVGVRVRVRLRGNGDPASLVPMVRAKSELISSSSCFCVITFL